MANMLLAYYLDSLAHRPRPRTPQARQRNRRAREAVETLPPYIDSRSDNIALLAPNLAGILPYLTRR